MDIKLFQVDAFTDEVFGGNSAAVCPLEAWLPDSVLLKIAQENALAETAFFVREGDAFHLRWFTPEIEMDLCGHATLASAHVLTTHLGYERDTIIFRSLSGELRVTRRDGRLTLDFPARPPSVATAPVEVLESLNIQPLEVLRARDIVLVYADEGAIRALQPDRMLMDRINLDPGGVVATAPGKEVDFVSRFFTPQAHIFEDPVTGSAHCSLAPYWAVRFGKTSLSAAQLSQRGGRLDCEVAGDRVLMSGSAVTYLRGVISI
ncbi:PhzF family phenazine biosynthesis isomerase [Hahella sp. KA22]|uniref:PhzF family phenazine biosynthesis protein n=1 Tax=Hahella sp. KA22 TaxID=1628392 RepID=UPI000FDF124E|nr:PhzF family phenazine biosynthesis protein [Hahella sp. KA22]AZZ94156.1 PhzF family phenazine biosynthesis protein [Hahella sp. KA22]QAY57530.1 PhzF family phenazine biosynthesis isomerase [Hahella sp. KA22]